MKLSPQQHAFINDLLSRTWEHQKWLPTDEVIEHLVEHDIRSAEIVDLSEGRLEWDARAKEVVASPKGLLSLAQVQTLMAPFPRLLLEGLRRFRANPPLEKNSNILMGYDDLIGFWTNDEMPAVNAGLKALHHPAFRHHGGGETAESQRYTVGYEILRFRSVATLDDCFVEPALRRQNNQQLQLTDDHRKVVHLVWEMAREKGLWPKPLEVWIRGFELGDVENLLRDLYPSYVPDFFSVSPDAKMSLTDRSLEIIDPMSTGRSHIATLHRGIAAARRQHRRDSLTLEEVAETVQLDVREARSWSLFLSATNMLWGRYDAEDSTFRLWNSELALHLARVQTWEDVVRADNRAASSAPERTKETSLTQQQKLQRSGKTRNHEGESVLSTTERKEFKSDLVVGKWKLGKKIGAGGQGEVWSARPVDAKNSPPRAIKFCFARDDKPRARFEQEVRLMQQHADERVLKVLEVALNWAQHAKPEHGEFAYYVSEYCEGSLEAVVVPWGNQIARLAYFRQACECIAFLHSRSDRVLHRDIKPGNFLISQEPQRRVVVADFGTAVAAEEQGALTGTREVVGSRFYRAPEVLNGADATPASEVYSLGRVLEFLTTGTVSEDLANPNPVPRGAVFDDRACDILDGVIRRASAVSAKERYSTGERPPDRALNARA